MRKKTFFQIVTIVAFVVIAMGSSKSSYPTRSSSSSTYYSSPSSSSSSSSSMLKKTDFPDAPCKSCEGRKGRYILDTWIECKRCNGTGIEPKH